jgi:hypothetical protein
MMKISDFGTSFDCALLDSLSVIRQTHVQLHVLTGMATTANVLASQIQLCDVLLVEISGIRNSLARDLRRTRKPLQVLN